MSPLPHAPEDLQPVGGVEDEAGRGESGKGSPEAATAAKRAAKKKARQSMVVDEVETSGEASRNVRKDKGKAKAKAKSKEAADPPKRSVKVKVKQEDPSPMEWHSTSKFL